MRGAASTRRVGFVCDSCSFTRVPTRTSRPLLSSRAAAAPVGKATAWVPARWSSAVAAAAAPSEPNEAAAKRQSAPKGTPDPGALAAAAEEGRNKLLSKDGIPSLEVTSVALNSCLKAATALNPQLKRAEAESKASATRLAQLGAERTGFKLPIDAKLQEAANKISYAAYTIITSRNVEMRPELLRLYVRIQAQLGRPESLPSVLELYATKPKPVVKGGEMQYVRQNPNAASKAIEVDVADLALRTAIEAKHLDSALGIIEASYCVPAFKRQKVIKHVTAPAVAVSTLPFSIFGISTAYALYLQNTMDIVTATGICFTGVTGYFLSVGSLGLIAKLSNKDQMRRVTWTPGTPLRHRWLREDERAALDTVACAWGFKEPWRHGEEMGPEWEGLKEYMGYRQMLLDRVEFMQGMK